MSEKEIILGKKINIPCPDCGADLVSPKGSHRNICPQCKHEFTEAQLR